MRPVRPLDSLVSSALRRFRLLSAVELPASDGNSRGGIAASHSLTVSNLSGSIFLKQSQRSRIQRNGQVRAKPSKALGSPHQISTSDEPGYLFKQSVLRAW